MVPLSNFFSPEQAFDIFATMGNSPQNIGLATWSGQGFVGFGNLTAGTVSGIVLLEKSGALKNQWLPDDALLLVLGQFSLAGSQYGILPPSFFFFLPSLIHLFF